MLEAPIILYVKVTMSITNIQDSKKKRTRKVSKRRGIRDKYCLVCYTEFSYSPTVKWCHPMAIEKSIRKGELSAIEHGDDEAFLNIWEKHKERVGNYKITLHKTNRKTHSLCLDCAILFLLKNFEEFDDRLFKELKIDDFVLCYKFECDKVEKKDKGTICKKKIELKSLHLLFPPVPIGILSGFDQLKKLCGEFDILPYVIRKLADRLLRISDPDVVAKRCVTKTCYGVMTLIDEDKKYLWICDSPLCKQEWCSRCNATHSRDIICKDFKSLTVWDDGTRKMMEEEVKQGTAKYCPNCDQIIQKISGCNHMTCQTCNTHFCWICLWVAKKTDDFTVNPVYAHMSSEH